MCRSLKVIRLSFNRKTQRQMFLDKTLLRITRELKTHRDLIPGEVDCIFIIYHIPYS